MLIYIYHLLGMTSASNKKAQRQHLKSIRNRASNIDKDWTVFRFAEKHYKARFPPPDLSNVLDPRDARTNDLARRGCSHSDDLDYRATMLKDVDRGRKAYIIPRIPGAVFYQVYT